MMRRFCYWLLYKKWGWTKDVREEHPKKFIIALAPHTSNWDFVLGQLYMRAEGMRINFLMKKEWFFWPLGVIFKRIGGIPVWRSKHTSMTDNLAATARQMDEFRLCITPEGTRSPNADWKKGFYFIAQKAEIPILLYGLDYGQKRIVCRKTFVPTGDVEKDMKEIKEYFSEFEGKHKENFLI
ncbi:MAG: 1-acyl-sn-glycerol-3-phosphate acyltransferase [Prevotella sp.]|nr:1-acyl-sn-glycerol-3-phosphate acyltransferase [Prevotella sp.]